MKALSKMLYILIWISLIPFVYANQEDISIGDITDILPPTPVGVLSSSTEELFGERYDPMSGQLSFYQTDINIQGNFSLPVHISRIKSHLYRKHIWREFVPKSSTFDEDWGVEQSFEDWSLDIPNVSIDNETRALTGGIPKQGLLELCQTKSTHWSLIHKGIDFTLNMYGSSKKFRIPDSTNLPLYPTNIDFVTDDHWIAFCEPISDEYMGLRVISPTGDTYHMNNIVAPDEGGYGIGKRYSKARSIFVSMITDKHGNWVKYENIHSSLEGRIFASDGREIIIKRSATTGHIFDVSANGKSWKYDYTNCRTKRGVIKTCLEVVTRPDSKKFKFTDNMDQALDVETKHLKVHKDKNPEVGKVFTLTYTHPEGAIVNYNLRIGFEKNYRMGDPQTVNEDDKTCPEGFSKCWVSIFSQLMSKKLNIGNNLTYLWGYDYSTEREDIREIKITGPENIVLYEYSELNNSIKETFPDNINTDYFYGTLISKATKSKSANLLLKKELFTYDFWVTKNHYCQPMLYTYPLPSIKFLSEKDTRAGWIMARIEANLPGNCKNGKQKLGNYNRQMLMNDQLKFRIANKTTIVGTEEYLVEYLAFDAYNRATKIKESNSFSKNEKYYLYQYQNDISDTLYELHKPKLTQISIDGESWFTISEVEYYPNTHNDYPSLPKYEKSFGIWQKKYSQYHTEDTEENAKGSIKKIEYNQKLSVGNTSANRYQTFENYKRGILQTVKLPNRLLTGEITTTRVVDDNGWIESETDLNGNTTHYTYDDMGRVATIKAPAVSSGETAWLDTVITWTYDGGTAADQPVLTQKRCTLNTATGACSDTAAFTTTTTYDSLLRPVLVKTTDGSHSVYQNARYNAQNQPTFQSYPSTAATETLGVSYVYDALQRLETTTYSGGGTVTNEYLAGNKIRVTDAGKNADNVKHSTTTTYLAYGQPAYEQATKIVSPESVTTDIVINIFGNPTSITQSGFNKSSAISQSEYRAYDNQQRLCQINRSDIGATVMNRNSLGEVQWQAQGQTATSNTVCNTTAAAADKVSFSYDNLGAQRTISYGDGTPIRTFTLDNNGNIKTITGQGFSQSYNYNSIDLLEDETLTVDGKALKLDYGYSSLGHLTLLAYPDRSLPINFATNAFGQPTQAIRTLDDESTDTFVYGGNSKATYHANGIINTFVYGNGVLHETELDTMNRPSCIRDYTSAASTCGASNLVSLGYSYDYNNNITSITNARDAGMYSLSQLTYDGLDRLVSTSGSTGIGSSAITYDSLGNIRTYRNTSDFNSSDLTYDYKNNFQLNYVKTTGTSTKVRDFSQSNSYDKRGNVRKNGNAKGESSFTYNLANQMTKAGDNTYLYDGYNRRIKTTDSKGTSYSMYSQSGQLLYRETAEGGINYIFLGDKLVAKEGTGVSASGDSIMNYKPFGESIEEPKDDVGYTGHKFDTDLGLSYMQARYYDPVIGRFYSNDPVGYVPSNVHSFGRYTYANNNPYKYVDPDGEFGQFFLGALVGGVAEAITQIAQGGSVSDWGEVGMQAGIGFVSGGTGGAAGKLASKAISALTKPASGMGSGASKVLTEGLSGEISGGVTNAVSSTLNQLDKTGTVDPGQVLEATGKGAGLGLVAGAGAGKMQSNASQVSLGNAKAVPMFNNVQPGATAGNIVGNSTNAVTAVADTVNSNCQNNGGC